MKKVIIIAIFLILAWQGHANAGHYYLGPLLGYDVLTGQAGRQLDDGLSCGILAGYRLNESAAVEISISFSAHDDVVDDRGAYTIDLWSYLIGPKFSFPCKGMMLYGTAGLGLYPIDFRFEPENTGQTPRKDDDTESGVYAGCGVDVPLIDRIFLGFDIKYHRIFNDNILDGDAISTQVRLGFYL